MPEPFIPDLITALVAHGFRQVSVRPGDVPDADLLLKRQTWNTNRAVLVAHLQAMPLDLRAHVRLLRRRVAFRCGFVPILWGIGIQLIIVVPGSLQSTVNPSDLVAQVDNQWAIIQSLFLVDPINRSYTSGRTWGQFVTGKFQDAIADVLSQNYRSPLSYSPHSPR